MITARTGLITTKLLLQNIFTMCIWIYIYIYTKSYIYIYLFIAKAGVSRDQKSVDCMHAWLLDLNFEGNDFSFFFFIFGIVAFTLWLPLILAFSYNSKMSTLKWKKESRMWSMSMIVSTVKKARVPTYRCNIRSTGNIYQNFKQLKPYNLSAIW